MQEEQQSHRYNDIKIRKCSNSLQNKTRELDQAIDELLKVGQSHWVEYKDIMSSHGALNWAIASIRQKTVELEYKIEMNEFRSTGALS